MTLAWMPMTAHSLRHEPWAPTLRPPPCSLALEPHEDGGSSSLQQRGKPFRAPKRTVRADDSWLNLPCQEQCESAWKDGRVGDRGLRPTYQSFYPPFPAQHHRASSSSEDSSDSKENDTTPPVQGSPLRARRASWMADSGEWRPTLSPMILCRIIPEDKRPQERPQRKVAPAVQSETAEAAVSTVLQQRRAVAPATEVAVAMKAPIPIGGTLQHQNPVRNDVDHDSDNPGTVSAPEQFDLTLNDTDDDEQDFFPTDASNAAEQSTTFKGATISVPASDCSSDCPIAAAQEARIAGKPETAISRRTRARRRGPRLSGPKGVHTTQKRVAIETL